MVPETGLEPVSLTASDFKSDVYTNSTTLAYNLTYPAAAVVVAALAHGVVDGNRAGDARRGGSTARGNSTVGAGGPGD